MMPSSDYHYLPLTPGFFFILIAVFAAVLVMVQLGLLRYAYLRLGLSPGAALALLACSLIGSYFNIPVAEFPGQRIVSNGTIDFYGMEYPVPELLNQPGTIIAVNIGGAIIPALMSIYLLIRYKLWIKGIVALALVAAFVHWLATPVPGLGIAVPIFVPAIATMLVAVVLAREHAAPLAYIAGSLGTLIGADLLNIDHLGNLGAPIASIGGAGTFDGIFLTGIIAVLLASFYSPPPRERVSS